MKTQLYQDPLSLEGLRSIIKSFPRYANIENFVHEGNYFLRRTIPCGHWNALLTDHDILCSTRMVHPHIENVIIPVYGDEKMLAIEGFNDERTAKNYFVYAFHVHQTDKTISIKDCSPDENQERKPMLVRVTGPATILLIIPHRENDRKNSITAGGCYGTDGKINLWFERQGEKTSGFRTLITTHECA